MNKPLTVEELKALPLEDWVYIVDKEHDFETYRRKPINATHKYFIYSADGNYSYSDYGTKWIAYKNKELAEVNEDNIPLEVEVQALHWTCFFKEAYIKQLKQELNELKAKLKNN